MDCPSQWEAGDKQFEIWWPEDWFSSKLHIKLLFALYREQFVSIRKISWLMPLGKQTVCFWELQKYEYMRVDIRNVKAGDKLITAWLQHANSILTSRFIFYSLQCPYRFSHDLHISRPSHFSQLHRCTNIRYALNSHDIFYTTLSFALVHVALFPSALIFQTLPNYMLPLQGQSTLHSTVRLRLY